MKGKRILSLVLAVMLMLGALPAGLSYAAAEDETDVVFSVVPSRTTALPGSTITYTIYLDPVSHFNGLQFTIGLPDGLTLVEDTKESTFYSQLHADYPDALFESSDKLTYLLYCFSRIIFDDKSRISLPLFALRFLASPV